MFPSRLGVEAPVKFPLILQHPQQKPLRSSLQSPPSLTASSTLQNKRVVQLKNAPPSSYQETPRQTQNLPPIQKFLYSSTHAPHNFSSRAYVMYRPVDSAKQSNRSSIQSPRLQDSDNFHLKI